MPHRIVLRIGQGIAEHFPVRVSEWIMLVPLLGWANTLALDPLTFDKSTSFIEMSRWADEVTWGWICFAAAFLRLSALIVNGTFKSSFPYSPHFRGFASLVICIFWGQITLGILVSVVSNGGVFTGFWAYLGFMLLEMWNLFRAWVDVGALKAARSA
ncbi:MAG TPA: hypothetical protein VEZ24_09160 [Microvirga sp.]|nr:hypothetical protein [Microvirga sp.]